MLDRVGGWTNCVRLKLTRPICGTYGKHFAQRGFEFSLLPNRIHAHPSAMLRKRKPLGSSINVAQAHPWYLRKIHPFDTSFISQRRSYDR